MFGGRRRGRSGNHSARDALFGLCPARLTQALDNLEMQSDVLTS